MCWSYFRSQIHFEGTSSEGNPQICRTNNFLAFKTFFKGTLFDRSAPSRKQFAIKNFFTQGCIAYAIVKIFYLCGF